MKIVLKEIASGLRVRTLLLSASPVFAVILISAVFLSEESLRNGLGGSYAATPSLFTPCGMQHILGALSLNGTKSILCIVVAICMQAFVNFANDYSDTKKGISGSDAKKRRLTESKEASLRVLCYAGVFALLGCVAGVWVCIYAGVPYLILVGATCILAGWFYSGGSKPYGSHALGEVFVFVYFGLVACMGTFYIETLTINLEILLVAVAFGCISTGVLVVDNWRDVRSDEGAAKITLAVLMYRKSARSYYVFFILLLSLPPLLFGAFLYRLRLFASCFQYGVAVYVVALGVLLVFYLRIVLVARKVYAGERSACLRAHTPQTAQQSVTNFRILFASVVRYELVLALLVSALMLISLYNIC
jgi:1,4-dihydroxy-2-naphthoate octaprenyltransferase